MPRSSRHKSSKHSLREVRDHSDSEKQKEKEYGGFKEKKGRDNDNGRPLKESRSSDKRRNNESQLIDGSKDLSGSGGEIVIVDDDVNECCSSSLLKKRKEKEDDRWTGGGDGIDHDFSKSASKRLSRRDGSSVMMVGFVGEQGKRIGTKAESKYHRSERKEKVEKGGLERERKSSKGESLGDGGGMRNENVGNEGGMKQGNGGDEREGKHGGAKSSNNAEEELRNPEAERESDRRVNRKRDVLVDGNKHQDASRELDDKRLSREDISRSDKYKDARIRDKFQDVNNWHQDDKQRDNRATREYTSGKSEEKHPRNEKKDLDVSQTKSKVHGNEHDREADQDRDRDRDYHDRKRGRERDRDRERARHDRERDQDIVRDKEQDDQDHDLDSDRVRDRELERTHDRDRGRDRYYREHDKEQIRDRGHSHDRARNRVSEHEHDHSSIVDDKGSRYKDNRGKRRSPDVNDDYDGNKSRRVELEADNDRSISRQRHIDNVVSITRHKASPPISRTSDSTDKYRDGIQDETKHGDSLQDDITSEIPDKVSKYRSGEKRTKFDDNHIGELSERPPSAKGSPAGIRERSPSANFDRRFQNRTSRRWILDVDDAERKHSGSNDARDAPVNKNKQVREFSAKNPSGEEYQREESPFYHKSSHVNMSSHGSVPSGFRSGADSPSFIGSIGDDSRGHSGSRYRRNVDPNVGRGPGNAWKGAPNWPSPLPNGFLPFPSGPHGPHGPQLPSMLSQFPPVFGVRPSDINHPWLPYHMGEGDRFPGHVRSIRWQNMVDGPVPPHFHGWDASNGLHRDEPSMYGPGHLANAQRRDMHVDLWKPNGDVNLDVTSVSQKESQMVKASMDGVSSAQGPSRTNVESGCLEEDTSFKMNAPICPSTKDISITPNKGVSEKTPESASMDVISNSVCAYLTKVDISMDMADPELYNQFINLVVDGEPFFLEDMEGEIEEKAVAKAEIGDLNVGLTFFPAVKDYIFQKAMELYKRQSTSKSSLISDVEKLHSHSTHPEVEQISVLKEKVDSPVDHNAEKEEPTLVVLGFSTTPVGEGKEPLSITSDEMLNGRPLLRAELALDDPGRVPVEKMDEDVDLKSTLFVESAFSNVKELKTGLKTLCNDVERGGGFEPASNEPLDIGASDGLVLPSDPVKVCDPLNLVSNESNSGIVCQILHAPESTH